MAAVNYHMGRFPPDGRLDWSKLVPFIGPATAAVARYDGTLAAIPNPSVLLAPLTTREAVLSSRIEGTQATMGEVLEFEAGQEPESPARRDAYYEGLLAVSRDDDWTGWCRFFLQAVQAQAEDNLTRTQGIIDLYDSMKRRVDDLTRSRYAICALDWIFERPIFRSSDFVTTAEIPESTARRVLKLLIGAGILTVLGSDRGRRPSMLCFSELLDIAEGRRTP